MKIRKDRVLGVTVNRYIKTFAPVSSAFLTNEYFSSLSSATIRGVLSELEKEGYLMHPHTSAGRVPTERGYRYYVDNLIQEIQLLEEEKLRIRKLCDQKKQEIEVGLKKISKAIAYETNYTGIVSVDGLESQLFFSGIQHVVEYLRYDDLQKIKNILFSLEEKERLYELISQKLKEKVGVFIGEEIQGRRFDKCSLVISCYQIKKGMTGRIAVLGPIRMDYQKVISTINYIIKLVEVV